MFLNNTITVTEAVLNKPFYLTEERIHALFIKNSSSFTVDTLHLSLLSYKGNCYVENTALAFSKGKAHTVHARVTEKAIIFSDLNIQPYDNIIIFFKAKEPRHPAVTPDNKFT